MNHEISSQNLLAIRALAYTAAMLDAISKNEFLRAAELAEKAANLAELATGKGQQVLRDIVAEMKEYQ